MADLVQITDHAARAQDNLLGQYQGRPRISAWVTALLQQVQEIEDAIYALYFNRRLENAAGGQLDNIGAIVGQLRQGMTDADYRKFIKARIKVNRSDGKIEQLIEIMQLILGTVLIVVREFYPAALEIEANSVTVNAYVLNRDFLQEAKAGGVGLRFIYGLQASSGMLRWSSSHGGVTLTTNQRMGSSHSNPTGGGNLAGVLG